MPKLRSRALLLACGIVVGALVVLILLRESASLPENGDRVPSHVIGDDVSTSLGMAFKAQLDPHPGQSGVHLLGNGLDAFVARAVSARLAERSIDVQYYMFHQDTVGRLLIRELLAAADRGVRVRMLIDDIYGSDGDVVWLALDAHPNVEVRLFNPFARGHSKNLQLVTRFDTANHRMHSKSFTVDNQLSIVGGRNIGDEYFDANKDLAFSDLDVMTIGPAVPQVSRAFDEYWNNDRAYPIATLTPAVQASATDKLRRDLAAFYDEKQTSVYVEALKNSALAEALRSKTAQFSFAEAKIIYDSPDKQEKGDNWKGDLLISQLAPYVKQATREFILVSPYFVPGQQAADALCALSAKGVRVRILTNSLVSNDVMAVHAGYLRHRKELVRCGVELYELNEQIKKEQGKRFTWLPGVSKSSLHAKAMAIDGKIMFVGSLNFDQRSLNINNEIGILFREPELAARASKRFDDHIDVVAFRVELVGPDNGSQSLQWSTTEDGKKIVLDSEPYAGFWKVLAVNLMRILPIYSML